MRRGLKCLAALVGAGMLAAVAGCASSDGKAVQAAVIQTANPQGAASDTPTVGVTETPTPETTAPRAPAGAVPKSAKALASYLGCTDISGGSAGVDPSSLHGATSVYTCILPDQDPSQQGLSWGQLAIADFASAADLTSWLDNKSYTFYGDVYRAIVYGPTWVIVVEAGIEAPRDWVQAKTGGTVRTYDPAQ